MPAAGVAGRQAVNCNRAQTEHSGSSPGASRRGVDERVFIEVNDELRTSAEHVYAAGDLIGPYTDSQMATPVGAQEGGIAAENALTGESQKVDHRVTPRAIFTDPPVGVVGLSHGEAKCARVSVRLPHRADLARSSRRSRARYGRRHQDGRRCKDRPSTGHLHARSECGRAHSQGCYGPHALRPKLKISPRCFTSSRRRLRLLDCCTVLHQRCFGDVLLRGLTEQKSTSTPRRMRRWSGC